MQGRSGQELADAQMEKPLIPLAINRVGIKGIKKLLRVQDRENGSQLTMADVSLAVDLPAHLKGTHMSRLVEALEGFDETLTTASLRHLLGNLRLALFASAAYARFSFPFLMRKIPPASGKSSSLSCFCAVSGELDARGQNTTLEFTVPVMTVCPCSLAICDVGAHSQRADVRLEMGIGGLVWIEEFMEIAEESSSSPVYSLLKREDEKIITEKAFSRPMFVEDVVRSVSKRLAEHPQILWFRAEVESQESIHGHNAFASVSMDKRCQAKRLP